MKKLNAKEQADKIVMASEVSNRYTQADALADREWKIKKEREAKIEKWLQDNPEVGVLNSGVFYYHTADREYKEVEVFHKFDGSEF
jgi:hypothetical protein